MEMGTFLNIRILEWDEFTNFIIEKAIVINNMKTKNIGELFNDYSDLYDYLLSLYIFNQKQLQI